MNPHPVEAPPPFARHHRLCKRLVGVGACREPGGGGRAAFAAARWPSFGLNCSVYYPCGISNYLFLLDRPLARMTLISLAARLHTFNWCVTSRQLRPLSLSFSLSLSLSLFIFLFSLSTWRIRLREATMLYRILLWEFWCVRSGSDFASRRDIGIMRGKRKAGSNGESRIFENFGISSDRNLIIIIVKCVISVIFNRPANRTNFVPYKFVQYNFQRLY